MKIQDSNGKIIGHYDGKTNSIVLVNSQKPIRIKKKLAEAFINAQFHFVRNKIEHIITMRQVIEDGTLDGNDYVYQGHL